MSENILYGSSFAGWRDLPFGNSSPPEYPPFAPLLKSQDTTHRDGVQRKWGRPTLAARQLSIPFLFASLTVVSAAVVFLVYMCSWFMRKRITRFSLPRRLASRWGGETCELFDPSSTESRADTFSTATGTPNLQDAGIQLFPGLTPVNELEAEIQDAFSVEVTAGAAAQVFLGTTTEQVTTDGMHAGLKRKGEEVFIGGAETPNLQDAGIQLFPGLTPVDKLEAEIQDAFSVEVTAGAAAQVFLGTTNEQVTTDGMHAGLKRKGEEVFIGGDSDWAKKLLLEVPPEEDPLEPAFHLDPELDAFIDSVLLDDEDLTESAWLLAEETETSEPVGVSAGSRPSTSPGASGLAQSDSTPWSAVYDQLSVPSHVAGDLWENHEEGSCEEQHPAAGPSAAQNMLRGSAADVAGPLVSTEPSFAATEVSF